MLCYMYISYIIKYVHDSTVGLVYSTYNMVCNTFTAMSSRTLLPVHVCLIIKSVFYLLTNTLLYVYSVYDLWVTCTR